MLQWLPMTIATGQVSRKARIGATIMALAGLGYVIQNVDFFFQNFSEDFLARGITIQQVGVTKAEIRAFNADLMEYISHLHIAVAGLAIALGIALSALAWFGVRSGFRWAWWTAMGAGVSAAIIGIPAHFVYGLATVGHLGPVFAVLLIFLIGATMSFPRQKAG